MTIDLTDLIIALIGLAFTYASMCWEKHLKAKTTKEEQEVMFGWASIFVSAVEEMHRAGLLKGGEAKFNKVMELLEEKGYTFDTEASKAVITGCVWKLINQFEPEEEGGSE